MIVHVIYLERYVTFLHKFIKTDILKFKILTAYTTVQLTNCDLLINHIFKVQKTITCYVITNP